MVLWIDEEAVKKARVEMVKAFVAGATGNTGWRIVTQFVNRDIPVRALVCDRNSARVQVAITFIG